MKNVLYKLTLVFGASGEGAVDELAYDNEDQYR